jgi:hypothetical protein
MADVQNPAGASSPSATLEAPRDPQAYATWRQTGELPDEATTTEDPDQPEGDQTEDNSAAGEHSSPETEKGAPASEAGKQTERRRSTAEDRKAQLNREIQDLLKKRDSLRAEAGEKPTSTPESSTGNQAADKTQQAPQVAPQVKDEDIVFPDLKKPEKPQKPNSDNFKSWDDYEKAREEYQDKLVDYSEQMAEYRAEHKLRVRDLRTARTAAQEKIDRDFAEAGKRYADFDTVAGPTLKTIITDRAIHDDVKNLIGISPVFADLVYTIGGNKGEAEKFLELARKDRIGAIRKIVILEGLIQAELTKNASGKGKASATTDDDAGAGERDERGRFTGAPNRVSNAPEPPDEVGGRGTATTDESERAFKRNDFRAFMDAENRRDLERRKGR